MKDVAEICCFLLSLLMLGVSGVKYEVYKVASTWDDARDTCQSNNMRLVHVTEHLQHVRIQNYRGYIFDDFWIGLKKENSRYQWTDNSVAKFTAWGQGQPSSQSECVRYSTQTFTWQTHNCSAALYFMCENDVPSPKKSGAETMVSGLLIGFASMFGLLLFGILLNQLPCCRTSTVQLFGQFGFGRR